MRTKGYTTYKIILLELAVFVFILGTPLWAFAKPVQVAIVPFKINAEKDLSFLKDGIVDMLSARLYWEDKVSIINRQAVEKAAAAVSGTLNESKARKLGASLSADYVLFGSLTVFGNSVSIDAKMVNVSGKKPALTFFNQSQGMDQVIPAINLFATDINEKEFGRVMETRRVSPSPQASATPTGQAEPDFRAHPDKLLSGGFSGGEMQNTQKGSPGSAFISTEMAAGGSVKFWKSRNIRQRITGMAIGDIDGDGKNETVFTTDHTLEAYRYENNLLSSIPENLFRKSSRKVPGITGLSTSPGEDTFFWVKNRDWRAPLTSPFLNWSGRTPNMSLPIKSLAENTSMSWGFPWGMP
ncbi:MAG: hypothetical protein P8012_10575 [Desulfobacterales bacterium]